MKKKAKKPSAAAIKKVKFAQAVFAGKTQRQAAKVAGYKGKRGSVDAQASKLMADPIVAAEVEVLQEKARTSAVATRDEVLELLTRQLRADPGAMLAKIAQVDQYGNPRLDSSGKALLMDVIELAKARKAGLLEVADGIEIDKDNCVKISFPSKHGAIDRLAKLEGWNAPDKHQHEHKLRPAMEMTDAELIAECKKTVAELGEGGA